MTLRLPNYKEKQNQVEEQSIWWILPTICLHYVKNISIFYWIIYLSLHHLERSLYLTRRDWSCWAYTKSLKFNQLHFGVHLTSNPGFIFLTKFQLGVGPYGLSPLDDTQWYKHHEHSQSGPTCYTKGWLSQCIQLWGKSAWTLSFSTEETQLSVNSMSCSHSPAGCFGAIASTAMVILVLHAQQTYLPSTSLSTSLMEPCLGLLEIAPFNPMDKEVD